MNATIATTDLRPERNCVRVHVNGTVSDEQRSEIERSLIHDHGIHHSSERFGGYGLRFYVDPESAHQVRSTISEVLS